MSELIPRDMPAVMATFDPTTRVDLLRDQLEFNYQPEGPHTDDYHRACSGALADLLAQPLPADVLNHHLTRRMKIKPHEVLSTWALERLTTTGLDMIARRSLVGENGIQYSPDYMLKDAWIPIAQEALGLEGTDNAAYASFKQVIEILDLNRIRGERRSSSEFVLKAFENRWHDEPIDILDIGCSRGDLLLMTAMNEPHEPIEISQSPADELYSRVFNQAINSPPPPLGLKNGVDIYPPDDEVFFGEWFESNCLRFGNIENAKLVDTIKRMGGMALKNQFGIEQFSADFSKEDIGLMRSVKRPSTIADRYHLIISSFVYDYLDRKGRNTAVSHTLQRLAPNGMLLVQGFITTCKDSPLEIGVLDSDAGGCMTLGLDATHLERGWQELFHWEDGGCTKGTIGKSALSEELWANVLTNYQQ